MDNDKRTIERKVADAILQQDVTEIEIAGERYKVAPPTIGTLIMVSGLISTLPVVKDTDRKDASAIVSSVLHHAKDFSAIGEIAAILILGAKGLRPRERRGIWRWLGGRKPAGERKKERLAGLILDNMRPSVLWEIIIRRLNMHEIGDFFAITTSLSEANLLRPTREVE